MAKLNIYKFDNCFSRLDVSTVAFLLSVLNNIAKKLVVIWKYIAKITLEYDYKML